MSVSNDSTSAGNGGPLSSTVIEFCAKVRNNDPSILSELGRPFIIRPHLSEKGDIELADALLKNTNVTYQSAEDVKLFEKICRGNGQVRAYQQARATHSLAYV
jgi:hypothetical protein